MPHPSPRLLIPLAFISVLGFGGWYVDAQRAKTRSTLSGFFESQPTEIASRIGGRVAKILVQEGEVVHAGQPLLRFETNPNRADTEAKEAQAKQAEEQFQEVRNGPRAEDIQRQEAVVAELSAALLRLKDGPLPEEIAASRAHLAQTEAAYRRAKDGARPQEIAEARAAERDAWERLAQSRRGLTDEEKAEAKARLDSTATQETLAQQNLARMAALFDQGAISAQQMDQAKSAARDTEAKRHEMEEAYRRAIEGTPKEELAQAEQAWKQAKAALDLTLAGSRKEDIDAAAATAAEARQNLKLLLRGSRQEDIAAAAARLAQAQASLEELRAGSRKEDIRQAKAAAKAAADMARSSKETLGENLVRAPMDGVVERVLISVGDLITPDETVIRLNDPKDIWLRVYVPEKIMAKVAVGGPVELQIDGLDARIPAIVESVATSGEFTPANLQTPDERGKQVFGVRIRLKPPDPRIKAGMYATVKRLGDWQ